nr:MAG TPA: hypothetical protein [Caudoviricetes sp.]
MYCSQYITFLLFVNIASCTKLQLIFWRILYKKK